MNDKTTNMKHVIISMMILVILIFVIIINFPTNGGFDKKELKMENYMGRAYHYDGDTAFVIDYTLSATTETLTLMINGRKDEIVRSTEFVDALKEINVDDIPETNTDEY